MRFSACFLLVLLLSACSPPNSGQTGTRESAVQNQSGAPQGSVDEVSWTPPHVDDVLEDAAFWRVLETSFGKKPADSPLDPSLPSTPTHELPASLPAKIAGFVAQALLRSEVVPIEAPISPFEAWTQWKEGADCIRVGGYTYLIVEPTDAGRFRVVTNAARVAFLLGEADSRALGAVLATYSRPYSEANRE